MNKKTIIYSARNIMGNSPHFFPFLRLMMKRNRFITPESSICIEGFPRSANSIAVTTFRLWNPSSRVAHHVHVPYQVIYAVKWKIPTIVLIRKPVETLASLLIIDESLSLSVAIGSYINFYEKVIPFCDEFILAEFEDVIANYQNIIQKVNSKFSTSFFSDTLEPEQRNFISYQLEKRNKDLKQNPLMIAIPRETKEIAKTRVREKIQNHSLFKSAQQVYAEITSYV